jgi:hypothetical protein
MVDSTPRPQPAPEGLLPRLATRLRQAICGLHGHDTLLHFGTSRLSLHCVSCGYESPGWEVQRSVSQEPTAQAPRGRVIRMPLVGHRRVA